VEKVYTISKAMKREVGFDLNDLPDTSLLYMRNGRIMAFRAAHESIVTRSCHGLVEKIV